VTQGLRILMPSMYFPPRVGGIESHVYYLARELVRKGNNVDVVTTRTEPGSRWRETVDGVGVHRLPSFGKHFAGWTLSSIWAIPEVLALARGHDIVHCHTFAMALSGGIATALIRRPLVVTVHSSHFLRLARRGLMWSVMKALLAPACALLSTSKEIDRVVRDMLPGAVTLPIVNGIDTETFKACPPDLARREGEFLIVCPRRLVEKNGVEFLVRALPHLEGKVDARVYVAGDGPLRQHLERVAGALGVRERIVFMGSVANSRMPAVYSSADLVVIPSLIEATSIAALEAMACERVVAASRVGGLPEIIDSGTGVLFESGSPDAIADAIIGVARRPDMRELGKRARERVEANWSISRVAEVHLDLYRGLLKGSEDA
jgi:glycosyltransferase involved in cell wall biosynthesis